ncbi:WecB/TagA/CpsF family glycosyltransferase [bacterium]|nr:WecB/TagA/CpsF family glycosyltransferase [bacterium]
MSKLPVLGLGLNAIDYAGVVEKVLEAAAQGRPFTVSATAVHGLICAVLDARQRYRMQRFDLVVPDGQPLVWALNHLHRAGLIDRVYGPELTLRLCEEAARRQLPLYLYGSRAEVLGPLQGNLLRRFPNLIVAGSSPSLFRRTSAEEKTAIVERIRASGARWVLLGLGCPRQEVWAYEYRQALGMPIVAVGAAFDFHAGTLAQAPAWMQKRGLEWCFRLVHEPRRLWKRYLTTNPLFLGLLLLQILLGNGFLTGEGLAPERECLFG